MRRSRGPPRPSYTCTCIHSNTEAMSAVLTIRVRDNLKKKLDALARSTGRSKSWLAAEALASYVELEQWQIEETVAAMKEAEAGDFASDREVRKLARKWKVNAR